jgi:hypothetical protein
MSILSLAHSSLQTCRFIAKPGIISSSFPALRHLALPRSQSVRVMTREVRSTPLLSSACSIVCVAIRPSESKVNMNMPEKSSPLLRLKTGLSPPSNLLKPRLSPALELAIAVDASPEFEVVPLLPFLSVFHRTTSFSSPRPERDSSESWGWDINPVRTIFSERICSLTLPTRGTQPHATGAVQRAAR